MNKRSRSLQAILSGFLIVSLVSLSGCGLKAENEQLKKENVALKQQVESLTTETENRKKEAQDLNSKITALMTENDSLKKENNTLKAKLAPPKKGTPKKK